MTAPSDDKPDTPFHAGEIEVQERLGVREIARDREPFIRDRLTEQHRAFFPQLSFLPVGVAGADRRPIATILEGAPGFISCRDPGRVRIEARISPDDPAASHLTPGASLGALGIELETRRRNRFFGEIVSRDASGLDVAIVRAFGNCPKYIRTRSLLRRSAPSHREAEPSRILSALDQGAIELIRRADCFFVASSGGEDGGGRRGADVSHRGGRPGFVRVEDDALTVPDFAGNMFYNTIGNFRLNPRAGLVFWDFETGALLHVGGVVEMDWDGPEVSAFPGAERLWRLRVESAMRRPGAMSSRWASEEASPFVAGTGVWTVAPPRAPQARRRRLRLTGREVLSPDVCQLEFEPADAEPAPSGRGGQHISVILPAGEGGREIIRSYSLTSAPCAERLRVAVKRIGAGSAFLHDGLALGEVIEAGPVAGAFTLDVAATAPANLIAGGIGVTPMIGMIRHALAAAVTASAMRPIRLLQIARSMEDLLYADDLEALVRASGGKLSVRKFVTGREGLRRRPAGIETRRPVTADLERLNAPDADWCLCGPGGFMQRYYDLIRSLGASDRRIHAEGFGPSVLTRARSPEPRETDRLGDAVAEVTFARSGVTVGWHPRDGDLLSLAEAVGLTPQHACRTGMCGACQTRIIEGAVDYAEPPEFAADVSGALICSCRPKDGRLVLDL